VCAAEQLRWRPLKQAVLATVESVTQTLSVRAVVLRARSSRRSIHGPPGPVVSIAAPAIFARAIVRSCVTASSLRRGFAGSDDADDVSAINDLRMAGAGISPVMGSLDHRRS
jgi:hypothetical protein